MKVTVIINGTSSELEIPLGWKEVSFATLLKIYKLALEPVALLSKLWDIDEDILKRSKIINFESVAAHLNSLALPMEMTMPKTILGFEIPKDLNFEEIGRYWDIKHVYDSMFDSEGKYMPDLSKFPLIVTAAVMPNYLDQKTSKEMQDEFAIKLMDAPCEEVMAIANFCIVKLSVLKMVTGRDLSLQAIQAKKWQQVLINWVRNSVLFIRLKYWSWKLKV